LSPRPRRPGGPGGPSHLRGAAPAGVVPRPKGGHRRAEQRHDRDRRPDPAQWFFAEVHHPDDPFSAAGDARTTDDAEWFGLALTAGLAHPGQDVLCSTLGRSRRVYRDGLVAADHLAWPFDCPQGEYRW